ncbi:integrase core domain-containing protein [Kribbella sp. NBC_00359]|uniref:integrase core domain-containing protein n=1 Tax=Kribbella sp. NBC_00359 TaxID=2975966 RepID=UPI002E1E6DCB
MIENFFGHLKEETFHHVRHLSLDALTTALHDYIHWYNNDRISTRLEGLSPVQCRTQALGLGFYPASPTIGDHFTVDRPPQVLRPSPPQSAPTPPANRLPGPSTDRHNSATLPTDPPGRGIRFGITPTLPLHSCLGVRATRRLSSVGRASHS